MPPVLGASGSLLPGSPLSITIDGGPPDAAAALVVGLSADPLHFKGGLLVPTPDLLVPVLLAADGSLDLATTWPAGLTSPLAIVLQAWCVAPSAAQGFVGTDALLLAPP